MKKIYIFLIIGILLIGTINFIDSKRDICGNKNTYSENPDCSCPKNKIKIEVWIEAPCIGDKCQPYYFPAYTCIKGLR